MRVGKRVHQEDFVAIFQRHLHVEERGLHQSLSVVERYTNTSGFTIIVEQPTSEAFAIPNRLRAQLGVAIALALLAMLVVGYVWGHRFIAPILNLTRATQGLAAGRLDERVPVDSADELGQLGNAFNNMAGRLVELQENIRKNERQATFGRIAVGLVHDLSHPIMNIGNSCKLMVKMFDDSVYRHGFLGQPGECIHAAVVSANARRTTAGARKPSRSINHCWL